MDNELNNNEIITQDGEITSGEAANNNNERSFPSESAENVTIPAGVTADDLAKMRDDLIKALKPKQAESAGSSTEYFKEVFNSIL